MSYQVDLLDRNLAIAEGRSAEAARILYDRMHWKAKPDEPQFSIDALRDYLAKFNLECDVNAEWNGRIELDVYEGCWDSFPEGVLEALAPVIEDGCIAVFHSEEHDIWRYVYRNGGIEVQHIDLLGVEGWY